MNTQENVLCLGTSDTHQFIALHYSETGALVLSHYNLNTSNTEAVTLDLAPPDVLALDWHCGQRKNHACISSGNFLAWRYPQGHIVPMQLMSRSIN